jgi:hypothetical protein
VARQLPVVVLAVLALAACGGGSHRASTTSTAPCRAKAEARALARLQADLAALNAAGRVHVKNTLLGGPAANHATDRFLLDLSRAPIDNLARNRLIDHAAAAIVSACQQCFQALEAERPIPTIAHEGTATTCG